VPHRLRVDSDNIFLTDMGGGASAQPRQGDGHCNCDAASLVPIQEPASETQMILQQAARHAKAYAKATRQDLVRARPHSDEHPSAAPPDPNRHTERLTAKTYSVDLAAIAATAASSFNAGTGLHQEADKVKTSKKQKMKLSHWVDKLKDFDGNDGRQLSRPRSNGRAPATYPASRHELQRLDAMTRVPSAGTILRSVHFKDAEDSDDAEGRQPHKPASRHELQRVDAMTHVPSASFILRGQDAEDHANL